MKLELDSLKKYTYEVEGYKFIVTKPNDKDTQAISNAYFKLSKIGVEMQKEHEALIKDQDEESIRKYKEATERYYKEVTTDIRKILIAVMEEKDVDYFIKTYNDIEVLVELTYKILTNLEIVKSKQYKQYQKKFNKKG